jgi:hypothetical protein
LLWKVSIYILHPEVSLGSKEWWECTSVSKGYLSRPSLYKRTVIMIWLHKIVILLWLLLLSTYSVFWFLLLLRTIIDLIVRRG